MHERCSPGSIRFPQGFHLIATATHPLARGSHAYRYAWLLALALLVGALAWRFGAPATKSTSTEHSYRVMDRVDELRLALSRAESRQWAYFLTQEPGLLKERALAIDAVQPGLDALRALTLDNPSQQRLLDKLQAAIDRRMGLLATSLLTFQSLGRDGIAAAVNASRVAADEALDLLQQTERAERALLEQRKNAELARWLTVAGVMALLLAALAFQSQRVRTATRQLEQDEETRAAVRAALLKTNPLQDAIFKSTNFSSIATDASGVIQIFNPGAERMLGYGAAEVVDKISLADMFDPAELAERAAAVSAEFHVPVTSGLDALIFRASRSLEDTYELSYLRKDGSHLPAVVSATALRDGQEAIIGYLLIGTDNTARKQIEAERARLNLALHASNVELQAAMAEADRANRAKSDFLSSMSHELRSPLNAILGFAQLMDSELPPLTPGHKESAAQIIKAGWYLLELINEILDLAAIEAGKVSLSLESLSLDELMQDCLAMVEPQAHEAGIQVRFTQPEKPVFVMGDRTRVKQILVNLLSNSIKYNRARGAVEVTCSARPDARVRLSFRDTGQGLGPDKLAQLFQPFNRLGQESGLVQGTGIGLFVSKQLAEIMGGTMGVESAVGVGSVFWVELAAAQAVELHAGHGEPTAPGSAAPGAQRTVLCVEDNPANLLLVSKLLARRPDIRLLTARNALQGIELVNAALPDVILMDINLPGISGITALKILHGNPLTSHIPVVAISANAMPRDVEKGLEAGFFRYLTKPINVVKFMDTLDTALEQARAVTQGAVAEPPSP